LPSPEEKLDLPRNYLHWHFLDVESQPEIWLAIYASDDEREAWASETGQPVPPRRQPPHPRGCRVALCSPLARRADDFRFFPGDREFPASERAPPE
jgi:hypothetical protein